MPSTLVCRLSGNEGTHSVSGTHDHIWATGGEGEGGECPSPSVQKPINSPRAKNQGPSCHNKLNNFSPSTLVACSAACLANTNTGCQSYSLYSGQCELGHDPWGGVQVTDSNPTPKAMVGSADIYSAVCTTGKFVSTLLSCHFFTKRTFSIVQPFSCYSPTVVDWSVLGDWGRLELQGAFFNDPTVCDGGNAPYPTKYCLDATIHEILTLLDTFFHPGI